MEKECAMTTKNWTFVELCFRSTLKMADWCKENCVGQYRGGDYYYGWWFELEEDAVAFKLYWL